MGLSGVENRPHGATQSVENRRRGISLDRLGGWEQIRRMLVHAAGPTSRSSTVSAQLELPLFTPPGTETIDGDLRERSGRLHELLIELVILVQMETADLVESPLARRGRLRLGLGSDPPLRLLEEWERAPAVELHAWMLGVARADREQAWHDALGRARYLADLCGLTAGRIRDIVRRLYPVASRASAIDDLPGVLAAHGRRHHLARNAAGRLVFRVDPDRRRGGGVVHTPPEPAAELLQILWKAGGFTSTPDLLDPACGSGQFLLAAAERILGDGETGRSSAGSDGTVAGDSPASSSHEGDGELLGRLARLRHLHGVEVDPASARIAAWNLSYWAACRLRDARRDAGDADRRPARVGVTLDGLFGPQFPFFLGSGIQVGNALQVEPSSFSPGFLWEKRYAEVFSREHPGFDLVVGNPPWISYGLRDHAPAPQEERDYYERLYPAGTQYKLTLYPIFIELALRLCRPGGVHGFLVPDSILAGHHFSRIRRLLVSTADLIELTLLEGPLWHGVHVGHTLLYAVRRKGDSAHSPVTVRNRVLPVAGGRILADAESSVEVEVPGFAYTASGNAPLRIYRDGREVEFLSRMQSAPFRFRDVVWTYSGLIARHGQKTVQSPEPRAHFRLLDARGHAVLLDLAAGERWRPALLSGAEVVPFAVRWRGGWIYWPGSRGDLSRTYKSGFDLGRYEAPKVFLRQTGDRLIAAVDRRGLLCLNNLHVVGALSRPGIPLGVVAGLLLSEPLQRVYRISSLESSRPLAQVDLKTVEDLPYPSDADGLPIGAGDLPARSSTPVRRILRRIQRGLADPAGGELVEMAESNWRLAGAPYEDTGVPGRAVLTFLLLELVEALEAEAAQAEMAPSGTARSARRPHRRPSSPGSPGPVETPLRRCLDEIALILFQISTPSTV